VKFKKFLLAASSVTMIDAGAAGFQLHETSISGLGRSFAGEGVVADDASVVARNPAAMTLFDSIATTFGVTYIDPGADVKGVEAPAGYTAPLEAAGGDFDVTQLDQDGVIPTTLIPIAYYINPIDERFSVGAGLNVNYGLASEYDDDYPAGSIAGKTELLALNANLSGAYRINPHWSFGAGLNVVYADAFLERRAGVTGASVFGSADRTILKLEGDDFGFGWNAGVVYELNSDHRFSLSYHSKITLEFDGDLTQAVPTETGPVRRRSGGSLETELPDILEFSGFHQLIDDFAFHYSIRRTGWDSFDKLEAFDSNGELVFSKGQNFVNTIRYALGVTYTLSDVWTLRAGLALDEAAADELRTIAIPDSDRLWYSAGATYKISQASTIDLGLSYINGDSVTIEEKDSVLEGRVPEGADEWVFENEANAILIGLGFNYQF